MSSYVIFDRDGTLIEHVHHLVNKELVQLKPDIRSALLKLRNYGFRFGIISNQSVIGRGLASLKDVDEVNSIITANLAEVDIEFDFILVCPHKPEDRCNCRKPKLGLGVLAKEKFQIDFSSSYYVGDHESDMQFGAALGCKAVQIAGNAPKTEFANYYSDTLSSAAEWIIEDVSK